MLRRICSSDESSEELAIKSKIAALGDDHGLFVLSVHVDGQGRDEGSRSAASNLVALEAQVKGNFIVFADFFAGNVQYGFPYGG